MAETDSSPDAAAGGATSVYKYFDKNGVLLYVGITGRGASRNSEHNKSKEWWQYVTRQEVVHYTTRRAALNIERQLIQQHRPPFNVQHNPGHAETRDAYLTFISSSIPMDAAYLLSRSLGSDRRVPLTVASVHDDLLTLVSHPADSARVASIDITGDRADVASGGRRARLVGARMEDGLLRLVVRVKDARQCRGADLMLRLGNGRGAFASIKRLDLHLPPAGRKRDRVRSAHLENGKARA